MMDARVPGVTFSPPSTPGAVGRGRPPRSRSNPRPRGTEGGTESRSRSVDERHEHQSPPVSRPPSSRRSTPAPPRRRPRTDHRGPIAAPRTKRLPLAVRRAPPERTGRLDSRPKAPPHVRQRFLRRYGNVLTRVDAIHAAFQLRRPSPINGFLVGLRFRTNTRQQRSRYLGTLRLGKRQHLIENRVDGHEAMVPGDLPAVSPANLAAISRPRPIQNPRNPRSTS